MLAGGVTTDCLRGERTRAGHAPRYAIAPSCWGQGYATEIARAAVQRARELALPELVGFTLTTNLASQRVLQNAGLRFEREIEHVGLPNWFGRLDLSRTAGK